MSDPHGSRPGSISALFEHSTHVTPDAPALVGQSGTLTYAQLGLRADRLAAQLQDQGITTGTTVGLCLERSPELILSVLGILKAGAAYVPIDPAYPTDRIALMLEDARPTVTITDKAHARLLPHAAARLLIEDADLENGPAFQGECPAGPDDLCYILFTSGSTGRPKGVAMHHAPLINLLQWQLRTSVLGAGDKTLQFAPISFDVSFQEIFTTFAQGGTLVMITDEDRLNSTQLLRKIIAEGINRVILPFVALQYLAEAVERTGEVPASLKEVFTSGEQLKITPAVTNLFEHLPGCRFCNQYGPTETHVVSELELRGDPASWPPLPSIGHAIDHVALHVLDAQMQPVAPGTEGELYLGGAALATGYFGREDLTQERFVPDPFTPGKRLYRTGDSAVELPDGSFDYKGRTDGQVKVRGYRIELGEVEVALEKHAAIQQAVATVREDIPGAMRLVGYYVSGSALSTNELRTHLGTLLPDYMVPAAFVAVAELPRTPSGKIDRKALPAPEMKRPELDVPYAAPSTAAQRTMATVWAELLGVDKVGIDDNFFDLGGNSLLSIRCVARLEEHHLALPIVKLYQHPTIRACAEFLEGAPAGLSPAAFAAARRSAGQRNASTDIAIIGMSGRFPGARNVGELWENLLRNKNSISTWTTEELDPSIPEEVRNDPDYVPARGVIADADKFDAGFFGVNPRVAALMDPQQRVFMETAWNALEDAAYDPARFEGLIGVYAGMGNNTYFTRNVIGHPELIEQVGDFQVMTGNEKDYIATRLAFEFNLRGPALSIHTACSTSLVAIAQAAKALRDGECDMALAGGIAITVPINSGILYNEGGMYSPDGSTRTFDAEGKGTSFSDGVGIIVLKRLDDAVRDRDHIYATVKGTALNNDGGDKASFTAPSVRGQAEVIAMAQADAGVAPGDITYVETHGTATPLGDPMEVEALTLAFRSEEASTGDPQGEPAKHCVIGSIKSNIGHLTAAAGAAGVIKTALALKEGVIPSNVGFETPNPVIDFAHSPFRVADSNIDWPRTSTPRVAGVSSFGVGGTNAHVVLGEAPLAAPSGPGRKQLLFHLSAKSKTSLEAMTENFRDWLEQHPEANLADASFTLMAGRRSFRHRRVIVGGTHQELIEAIGNSDPARTGTRELHQAAPGVVFMFPGQGSQYVGMGRDLHAHEPVFAQHFDQCCSLFAAALGTDLKAIILPAEGQEEAAAEKLRQTVHTQAALFTMHYSLAKLWMHWGITPQAMMGHSIGEFAAACLAGVFSLEDAVTLVAHRGRMMQELPPGSMLSVRAAEQDIAARLPEGCSIAANNGPQLCVVSGPQEAVARLQAELEQEEIGCKLLVTSHAFHSPMMDPMVEPYARIVEQVRLHTPRIPIVSTVTAQWLKDEEATSASYWSGHLRATVRFAQAVKFAWEDADRVMLEVGPRTTATTLARQQSADAKRQQAVPSLGADSGNGEELIALQRAVGGLWQSGVEVDLSAYFAREERHRLSLPPYPFERVRHWVDPVALQAVASGHQDAAAPTASAEAVDTSLSPKEALIAQIKQLLEESSGLELAEADPQDTFLEMGLDSLFLTQVATSLSRKFGVKISFRQLNEDLPNLDKLADHILPHWSVGAASAQLSDVSGSRTTDKQLTTASALEDAPELKKAFGAQARISKEKEDEFTPQQRAWFDDLVQRYVAKTPKSKAFTQANRDKMADPRVVTGFKPQTKELIYQVVVDRSEGCHLWDLDGNEYVDILSGFGSSMFGYMPDFIKKACHAQLDAGIEIGPMHPLAADVSNLLCELTGGERAAVCNTGSEAVLGAMRMARTVTGRSLIIAFSGSYHGINDEVIIRGSKSKKSYPGAPGILPEAVENMLILDYGTPESLQIIRERCHEAAAVLVEPVQSRRMEFRPVDFLRELRAVTKEHGAALIFDEVITGFRMHPNGAQALFGIEADIATYGKVIGGGMPIGAMIGSRSWMDALDGGAWQFGDDSVPEAGVTYFAGTFVRHPLTMAAAKAALLHMKEEGPALQEKLNSRTARMVERANELFHNYKLPFQWVCFGSAFKTKWDERIAYPELFHLLMRLHGVHVLDFPHFLTTAHTEADVEFILRAVEATCKELRASGFMPERTWKIEVVNNTLQGYTIKMGERVIRAQDAPISNARMGRMPNGDPAWFVPDPERAGKYLMLEGEEL